MWAFGGEIPSADLLTTIVYEKRKDLSLLDSRRRGSKVAELSLCANKNYYLTTKIIMIYHMLAFTEEENCPLLGQLLCIQDKNLKTKLAFSFYLYTILLTVCSLAGLYPAF